jgi:hypothetical protein
MTSFAVAEIGCDERDYDNWLVTLSKHPSVSTSCKP